LPGVTAEPSDIADSDDNSSSSDELDEMVDQSSEMADTDDEDIDYNDRATFHSSDDQRPYISMPWLSPDYIPAVDELKYSLDFIKALELATLDNGDLSEEALFRLRNPPQHELTLDNPDEKYSIKQFLTSMNSSQTTYQSFHENHNEHFPEHPMLSWDRLKTKLSEWTGIEAIKNDMCANSCIAYTGPFSDLEVCPKCSLGRREAAQCQTANGTLKIPPQQFYTIPLGPQLQALFRNPKTAQHMLYRQQRTMEILQNIKDDGYVINDYEDIYHGREYLDAYHGGKITAQDILVMSSMDGAQLYRDKQSDCWLYIWVVLELHPSLRYKKKHILPGGCIPGPNNPKSMESFLFPGFQHISALQKEGLHIWNAMGNCTYKANVFYYLSQ
jgi:hypothetical protein